MLFAIKVVLVSTSLKMQSQFQTKQNMITRSIITWTLRTQRSQLSSDTTFKLTQKSVSTPLAEILVPAYSYSILYMAQENGELSGNDSRCLTTLLITENTFPKELDLPW